MTSPAPRVRRYNPLHPGHVDVSRQDEMPDPRHFSFNCQYARVLSPMPSDGRQIRSQLRSAPQGRDAAIAYHIGLGALP